MGSYAKELLHMIPPSHKVSVLPPGKYHGPGARLPEGVSSQRGPLKNHRPLRVLVSFFV